MSFVKAGALTFFLSFMINGHAQTCNATKPPSSPNSRYALIMDKGYIEVLDRKTKLIWLRCSVGQTWSGSNCAGTAGRYSWEDALKQAHNIGSGYRLPNIKELNSLIEESCIESSINETIFPNTPSYRYWSSTPNFDYLTPAPPLPSGFVTSWYIDFKDGYQGSSFKYEFDEGMPPFTHKAGLYHVRPVRTAQ